MKKTFLVIMLLLAICPPQALPMEEGEQQLLFTMGYDAAKRQCCTPSGNGTSFYSGNGTIWTLTDDFGTPVVALNSSLLAADVTLNLTNAVQLWKAGSDYILETKGSTRLLVGAIADFQPTEILLNKKVALDDDIGLEQLRAKMYFGDVQNYITFDSYGDTQNQYHAFGQGGRYYIATTENIFDDMVHNISYFDNNSVNHLVPLNTVNITNIGTVASQYFCAEDDPTRNCIRIAGDAQTYYFGGVAKGYADASGFYYPNIFSDGDNVTNFIRNHTTGGSGGANLSLYDIFVPYNGSIRNIDSGMYNISTNDTVNASRLIAKNMNNGAFNEFCDFVQHEDDGEMNGNNCLDILDIPDLSRIYLTAESDPLSWKLTGTSVLTGATQISAGGNALTFNIGQVGSSFGLQNSGGTTKIAASGATNTVTLPTCTNTLGSVPCGGTGKTTFTAYSLIAGGTTTTGATQSIANSATAGTILRSAGTSVLPAWSTASYPNTVALGNFLFGKAANVVDVTSGLKYSDTGLEMTNDRPQFVLIDSGLADDDMNISLDDSVLSFNTIGGKAPILTLGGGTGGTFFNVNISRGQGNVSMQGADNLFFQTGNLIDISDHELIGFSGHNNLAGGKVSAGVGNFTGSVTVGVNLNVTGNVSFKRYYYSGYDNSTQLFLNTANTQVVNVSNNEDFDSYGINIVDKQNITFEHTGDYMITFMPQFFQQSGTNKEIEFWIEKNSVDVPYSNSRYTMENLDYLAPSIVWQIDIANPATDRVRIMWYSTSTNTAISSITGLTAPTRPSIPGVILNIQKVSEIT